MGVPVQENEVYIHDTYFPILGPVRRVNFAVTPNPQLFGDTSKAGDSVAMTQLTQTDYSGGSGVHLGSTRTDTNRSWTSDLDTTKHRGLSLPPIVIDMGLPAWAVAGVHAYTINEFNSQLWCAFGVKVGAWAGGAWGGAADHILAATPVESIVWGGNLYYAVAGVVYERRTAAGVWSFGTIAPISWADWDNKLWALDNGGLYSTLDGVTWLTRAARIPNPRNRYMKLCVYRDSTGASALYVHTDNGLWIYDPTFDRFLQSEIQYSPATPNQDYFTGVIGPDGRLFTTNGGTGLLALQDGNPMVITPVGLDRDDGYPASDDGVIAGLVADPNFVYALILRTDGLQPAGTKASLRMYRGGWHTRWKSTAAESHIFTSGYPCGLIIASVPNNKTEIYWSLVEDGVGKVYRMEVPRTIYNPRFFPVPSGYQAGPLTHVTPWWPFESEVQRKIFGHIFAQAKNHTATETTKIEYAIDLAESAWTLVTGAYGDANPITSDGLKEFYASIAGSQAKWIRFRFTQQRGGTVTLTPILEYYTAEIMRVLGPTYAYSVEIDLSKPWRKKTPEALRLRIEQLLDPGVISGFYQFSWQDELEGVRTHYGRLSREAGMGYTGPGVRGQGRETLSIIIPYHRDVS